MTRTCQRFSIPRTIEWIDGGNYIVSLKERDEESERSGASHGCGNKDTPQMETKASSMADTRESCTSIDGSHHDIDALHGNDSERVKTNESRRRGRKSTSGLPHKRRSKAQTYQSCIGDDRNGQIRRRKSLQLVSRKACVLKFKNSWKPSTTRSSVSILNRRDRMRPIMNWNLIQRVTPIYRYRC